MYCRHCGKQLADDAKFCVNCGQKVDKLQNAQTEQVNVSQPIQKQTHDLPLTGQVPPVTPTAAQVPPLVAPRPAPTIPTAGNNQFTVPQAQKASNKGVKTTFFILLGLAGILLVVLIIVLMSHPSGTSAAAILNQGPVVDYDELATWEKGEFSLANIGGESSAVDVSQFLGGWKLTGTQASPDNTTGNAGVREYDPSKGEAYIVLTDDNQMHSVGFATDGTEMYNHSVNYMVNDSGYITCESMSEGLPEGAYLKFIIGENNQLLVNSWVDEVAITDYVVYDKSDKSIEELLGSEVVADTETQAEAQPVETVQSSDLAVYASPTYETETPLYTVLTNKIWKFVGIATNPSRLIDTEASIFTLDEVQGKMYYLEFYKDNTMKFISNIDENSETILDYEIMDLHYCDTLLNEDGYGYRYYLGNDGLLYMCFYSGEDDNFSDLSDFLVFSANE